MKLSLPFFNWSLRKALDTEPDSFNKARIGIMYTILLFTILKCMIVIVMGAEYGQKMQVSRAVVALVLYSSLVKILLHKPSTLKVLANIMIQAGTLVVWSNIFVYSHNINLVTLQFVFMIILSSFYTLGSAWGFVYSAIATLPVVIFLVFKGNHGLYLTNTTQELPSPGFEIIAVLNFISITVSHYLFYRAFHINIREKEMLNRQLQLSIAEANKLAVSKSNFLSTVSHELRTPLNSVVGVAELLLEDNPEERQMENLGILQSSALDLLSLINNVLDFNKIDSDKLVLETVPFPLPEYMRNICSGFKVKAHDKKLQFILDIDHRLENTMVISDPTRLSQVIYNLVGNAVKFTDKGCITVKLGCVNKTDRQADVLFSIKDTGPGIHPDKHEAIFELFTQAESDTTRKYGGTGLGLAIVKQVLALFASSIQLESSPGTGSRFFFTMSFAITIADTESLVPAKSDRADFSNLRILIAEDNDVNRTLIKKQLQRMNVTPVIVENGELAYNACASGYFDGVFMDLHMPMLDGYEAVKKIRGLRDSIKANVFVIAFTATINEQQKIAEAGFNDYLHKPVSMSDLRDKLEKITHQKQVAAR